MKARRTLRQGSWDVRVPALVSDCTDWRGARWELRVTCGCAGRGSCGREQLVSQGGGERGWCERGCAGVGVGGEGVGIATRLGSFPSPPHLNRLPVPW